MADIFNGQGSTFGGSFSADSAQVAFSTGGAAGAPAGLSGGVGLLTQTIQFNYAQQITRLYEIGSNATFLVAGRTQGSLSLGRVLGPRQVQTQFYANYGNVCNAANNNITVSLQAGCTTGTASSGVGTQGTLAFLIQNVVIVSMGLTVAAEQMIVNENLQAMFVSLNLQG
jgi:hypothetical protein